MSSTLLQVRAIALSLPEVTERPSAGAPCFYVRKRTAFCRFHGAHRRAGRVSIWCAVPDVLRQSLLASAPDRFFVPQASASGTFGAWIGLYLDVDDRDEQGPNWGRVRDVINNAYRMVAPKTLLARLDER